jgi:tetratricopeptide (TPR) repeat protein
LTRSKQSLTTLALHLRWLARPLRFLGEFDEARSLLCEAREIAIQIDSPAFRETAEHVLAWTFLDQGNLDGVFQWLERCASCNELPDTVGRKATWSYISAAAYALQGDLAAASKHAAPLLRIAPPENEESPPNRPQYMAMVMRLLLTTAFESPETAKRINSLIASFARLQRFGEQDLAAYTLANPILLRQQPIDIGCAVANYVEATRLERYPLPPFLSDRLRGSRG